MQARLTWAIPGLARSGSVLRMTLGPIASNDNRATVSYRIMRAGELEPWASGEVMAHDPLPDSMLLSYLMDQTANRVVRDLRESH